MDKTKSKLAQFFDNDEEEPSFPQRPVDDAKLSQYASGRVRKTRKEKEAEAAEAKRLEEEESAARAYAEFLETFEGKESSRRGGGNFVRADTKTAYNPLAESGQAQASKNVLQRSPSPVNNAPRPKGKRAMDAFLEEIKREQAEREAKYGGKGNGRSITAMAAYDGQSGSKDRGDPATTNLFVANLPAHVTEHSLGNFFARIGPVGSVKIMWPRGDASSGPGAVMTQSRLAKNTNLTGFVSYMARRDAEEALREYDSFEWGGSVLRVGWSKAVPVASKPLYPRLATTGAAARAALVAAPVIDIITLVREAVQGKGIIAIIVALRVRIDHTTRVGGAILIADDDVTDTFIRAVAAEVKGHGSLYEKALKEREKNNSKYGFMLQKDHRRHAFYRGLLESEGFNEAEFDDEGYNSAYSTDSGEESERERTRKNILGKLARKRFEAMLRGLSGKHGEMARCMAFSLEHAEAAHEVADIIVASLLVEGTPVPRKVARLHLICDILHNSAATVPSAWRFRQEFQGRLGVVFDHLATIYHSFPGRITADLFKKQITTVVDIWEDWIVFSPDFTGMLRQRLEGNVAEAQEETQPAELTAKNGDQTFASKFKTSAFQPAMKPIEPAPEEEEDDGEPMDVSSDDDNEKRALDGEPVEDMDGEPFDDVDGEPVDNLDGDPVGDLDGEPVVDEVDGEPMGADLLDGEPLDDLDGQPADDLDGEPMS